MTRTLRTTAARIEALQMNMEQVLCSHDFTAAWAEDEVTITIDGRGFRVTGPAAFWSDMADLTELYLGEAISVRLEGDEEDTERRAVHAQSVRELREEYRHLAVLYGLSGNAAARLDALAHSRDDMFLLSMVEGLN